MPDVFFPKDTFSYDFFLKDLNLNKKNASLRKLKLRIIQRSRFIEKGMVQFVYRLQSPCTGVSKEMSNKKYTPYNAHTSRLRPKGGTCFWP